MATFHWKKYTLDFRRPSGTSRGVLHRKTSYFLIAENDQWPYPAIGECSLIEGLNPDPKTAFEPMLDRICRLLEQGSTELPDLTAFPAIAFGLEMLLQDMEVRGRKTFFQSAFTLGEEGMQINGLIWMGDRAYLRAQIIDKVEQGFECVKLKIGALDFATELETLAFIRKEFGNRIELRVDANGAFDPKEAMTKLKQLSDFDIHSIEQPIRPGQWDAMADLCLDSPVPIALDEELIGVAPNQRAELLSRIQPAYIILKPSLLGGWRASDDWIELAEQHAIGWWITSALESNIGLNAIAQYTFQQHNPLPQGLGTGGLYTNNFDSPLYLQGQFIHFSPKKDWELSGLLP